MKARNFLSIEKSDEDIQDTKSPVSFNPEVLTNLFNEIKESKTGRVLLFAGTFCGVLLLSGLIFRCGAYAKKHYKGFVDAGKK